ncbi:MAG: hypothetical protein ACPGPE_00370, partial [Planctomycetota bacterium]
MAGIDRLAGEQEHVTGARAFGLMLALTAVVVLGVNAAAIRLSPVSERTFDGRTVATKWRLASAGAPAGGVVAIGDSSGNFAVDTEVLEERLGVEARNYCTYGRFLNLGAGWFLDQALEAAEAPPSVVLVVMGSRTFALEADGFTFASIPVPIGGWVDRIPSVALPMKEALQFTAARLFPLYAQHRSFEGGIRQGLWQIDGSRLPIRPGGTSVLPRAYPDGVAPFAEKVLGELAAMADGPIPFDRDRAAMGGLARAAEEIGFDLVFVDGPVWEGLAIDEGLGRTITDLERVRAALPDARMAVLEAGWASTAA